MAAAYISPLSEYNTWTQYLPCSPAYLLHTLDTFKRQCHEIFQPWFSPYSSWFRSACLELIWFFTNIRCYSIILVLALPVSLIPVSNFSAVSSRVSDNFTVVECFTFVTDTAKELLTCANDTDNACITDVSNTPKVLTYVVSVTLSDIGPIGYRTYRISNLSDMASIGYRTYRISNLLDTEPIRFSQIPNPSYNEPIRYQAESLIIRWLPPPPSLPPQSPLPLPAHDERQPL